MKKLLIASIVICILAVLFAGCSVNTVHTDTQSSVKHDTLDISETVIPTESDDSVETANFGVADPTSDNAITVYRNEVLRRSENDIFLNNDEISYFESKGFLVRANGFFLAHFDATFLELRKFYYPVPFYYGDAVILWYTDEYGDLIFENIDGRAPSYFSNYGGPVHCSADADIIDRTASQAVFFDSLRHTLVVQHFCNAIQEIVYPGDSDYCGKSDCEGYLLHFGGDVYAINLKSNSCECIAHNVEYIIDASYKYSSDAFSQPLFLMYDGQVVAYVGWSCYGDSPDDPAHLLPLEHEGGYR